MCQWIGSRENLEETMFFFLHVFTMKYDGGSCKKFPSSNSMWDMRVKTMPKKPPICEWYRNNCKNGDDWGMASDCLIHNRIHISLSGNVP